MRIKSIECRDRERERERRRRRRINWSIKTKIVFMDEINEGFGCTSSIVIIHPCRLYPPRQADTLTYNIKQITTRLSNLLLPPSSHGHLLRRRSRKRITRTRRWLLPEPLRSRLGSRPESQMGPRMEPGLPPRLRRRPLRGPSLPLHALHKRVMDVLVC